MKLILDVYKFIFKISSLLKSSFKKYLKILKSLTPPLDGIFQKFGIIKLGGVSAHTPTGSRTPIVKKTR